ncbi:FCD domain-containing protein [Streptomyces sp. NPDC006640]|uniref:GntR family transcriptional regulator n=1 Tax=unclassified Streptomyces TaxID=2593676 RepID=UPI0036CB9759
MEQAGPRSAHASEGPGGPGAAAAAPRIPAQPRPAERNRPGDVPSDAVGDGTGSRPGGVTASARGEHTHGETPVPGGARSPAVVPAQGTRPGTRNGGGRARVPDEHRSAGPADALRPGAPADDPASGFRARPVVQRASVRGQILDALRTALVAGELAPGEVYSAPALGDRFGVSATPVREAMQQLALEGAVEVVPNRGFRVIERGTRELAELAEIRGLIEVPVMLRLARTVSAAQWTELRPLAEATVRAASSGCRATYAETDRTFHRAVLALAGNAQLVRIADDLHRRAQWPLVGGPVSRGRADLVADAAEHTALLDALIAGDLAVVQALVREHFTGAS